MLKKIESLLYGNELKTKTGVAFAVKCAQEKTVHITFDAIIDGLVFHAHEALDGRESVNLDDLASNVAFVCAQGHSVSRLNSLICEAQEPGIKSFFSKCVKSLGKFTTVSRRFRDFSLILFTAQLLAGDSNKSSDVLFLNDCIQLMANALS